MSTKDLNDLKLKWSKYAKKEPDWINEGPREIDDVRERVRRETLRGQTTVFHNSLEDYLTRQFRANTVPRVGIHLLLFSVIAYRSYKYNRVVFDGWRNYKRIVMHPSFVKLGYGYSSYLLIKPIFFLYLAYRVSFLFVDTVRKQWNGKTHFYYQVVQDEHYYDSWFKDSYDYRMVNFRYSDHVDGKQESSAFNHDIFKADADYYKSVYKFFEKGNDSMFKYFTNWKS